MHARCARRVTSASILTLLLMTTGLILAAQNPPPAAAPPESTPDQPEAQKERSYVRRISLGVSVGLVPFNSFPKATYVDKVDGPPVVEKDASVDPKSNRGGFGFV